MATSLTTQFRHWLAKQPRDAEYDYCNICGCAFYQFLTAAGYPVASVSGWDWTDNTGSRHDLPGRLSRHLVARPHTFGALADRLDA